MAHEIDRKWVSHGFTCVVLALDMGHRCGYVGVPESHPLRGKGYGDVMPGVTSDDLAGQPIGNRGIIPVVLFACGTENTVRLDCYFNVHGGLTYAGGGKYPIDQPGTWWFGFDCAHSEDAPDPEILARFSRSEVFPWEGIIRSEAYVVAECESLAEQLADVAAMLAERDKP